MPKTAIPPAKANRLLRASKDFLAYWDKYMQPPSRHNRKLHQLVEELLASTKDAAGESSVPSITPPRKFPVDYQDLWSSQTDKFLQKHYG